MSNSDPEKHPESLGRLWSNLLSLELVMRLCILRKRGQEASMPKLDNLREGDIVKESALTGYDSLGKVIDKFNAEFKKESWIKEKDKIVRLRDALAHGRFLSPMPSPMKFYKFGKPEKGKVRVELIEEMTRKWFGKNIRFIAEEVRRLAKFYEGLKK